MKMKRKKKSCVCRCTPAKGIVAMDARLLTEMVAQEQRCISVTPNLRRAATQAMHLGDACAASGHPAMAIDVWSRAYDMVRFEDYNLVSTPINTRLYRLADLVSKDEVCELGRRIDRTWLRLGHREMAHYAARARRYYKDLWLDKYYESLP